MGESGTLGRKVAGLRGEQELSEISGFSKKVMRTRRRGQNRETLV